MTYERTVSAALAETQSKFRLAEALALDIPPRTAGPKADHSTVLGYLDEARQAIVSAGGEDRAPVTLDTYRRTALWVSGDLTRNFGWLTGVSFSAHDDARRAGLTLAEFAAMPKKTVDAVRSRMGIAGTRGSVAVARNWTPQERTEAARELLRDPDVADAVMGDADAREQVNAARNRHDDRQVTPHPRPAASRYTPLDLIWDLRNMQKSLHRAANAAGDARLTISDDHRDATLEVISDIKAGLDLLEAAVRGGTIDQAIAAILADADR